MKQLDSDMIDAHYKGNPHFGGWYSKNRLPVLQKKFYIVNMQNEGEGGGTHWIMVYNCKPSTCVYFDSFGIDPPQEILFRMKETKKKCIMSDVEIQNIKSQMCGYYCLYVIDHLEKGEKFTDILLSDFSFNTLKNEGYINEVSKKSFAPAKLKVGGSIDKNIRPIESYTQDIKHAIQTIEMSDTVPYGSFKWKSMTNPSDIDLMSHIVEKGTLDKATESIAKQMKDVVVNIMSKKGYFVGDIKAGTDHIFQLDIGQIQNEKVINYNYLRILEDIAELYKDKKFTKTEYDYLVSLLKPDISVTNFYKLHEAIRNKYILRWLPEDVIKGYLILFDGRKILLKDAIRDNSAVKIDMFAPIDGKYIEVTNYLFLFVKGANGKSEPINVDENGFEQTLKAQIAQLSNKAFLKPFKLSKRIWALARYQNNMVVYKKLIPLFQSPISELGQMDSEIDTLKEMLKRIPKRDFPFDIVIKQIDNFKGRSTRINNVSFDESLIYKTCDSIVANYKNMSNLELINKLDIIQNIIKPVVNKNVMEFLEFNSLYPVPPSFLPDHKMRLDGGKIWYSPFDIYNKIKKRIVDVFKGIRKIAPPHVRKWLETYGKNTIINIVIARVPIKYFVDKFLNLVSLGTFDYVKKSLNYEDMFHLYAYITLDNHKTFHIEKNHVIEVAENNDIQGDHMRVDLNGLKTNLDTFFFNAVEYEKNRGFNIFLYDGKDSNCQVFIRALLVANGLYNEELNNFIMQDAVTLFERMPEYVHTVAKTITDVASQADVALHGEGVKKSRTYKNNDFKIFQANRLLNTKQGDGLKTHDDYNILIQKGKKEVLLLEKKIIALGKKENKKPVDFVNMRKYGALFDKTLKDVYNYIDLKNGVTPSGSPF